MKPLLSKTSKPLLTYVLIIFVISVPAYYFAVDAIWKHQLDEHNEIVVSQVSYQLNKLKLSEEKLLESIALWNRIQPETNLQPVSDTDLLKDSVYITVKTKPYLEEAKDRFRGLSTIIYVNRKPFRFTVETNIEESRSTITVIALITVLLFVFMVLGLLILNRKLSVKLWKPFRNTLEKLKTFNLNNETKVEFTKTDTTEFDELNRSLNKLIVHTVSAYKSQKQFTENASHELQTPLAILKNKLDILLQDKDLTERQYHIAEEMNRALTRSSRINQNLLLLARIDNSQFDHSELIRFDVLLRQSMEILQEYFEQKNISVATTILPNINVEGNSSLTEVLINNLVLNAIRHTSRDGSISVTLTKSYFEVSNSGTTALESSLLFKRFSKLSVENSGSGLGLSIVKRICKSQKWTVDYRFENNHHIFSVHL